MLFWIVCACEAIELRGRLQSVRRVLLSASTLIPWSLCLSSTDVSPHPPPPPPHPDCRASIDSQVHELFVEHLKKSKVNVIGAFILANDVNRLQVRAAP